MHANDYDDFAQLLDDAYDLIGVGANKVISGGAKSMFFAAMGPYSLTTVRAALAAHCVDKVRGRFTPKPADIIEQIEASVLNDGRPGAEEAWAISLRSRSEADTVVWTAECAEAFALTSPILVLGDEVGARMAFKEGYTRMVAQARAEQRPATWCASIGWDAARRDAALARATVAGLLPAPAGQAVLTGPAAAPPDEHAREQLAAIKALLAEGDAVRQAKLDAAHDERIAAEQAAQQQLAENVESYAKQAGLQGKDSPVALAAARHAANEGARLRRHARGENNRSGGRK